MAEYENDKASIVKGILGGFAGALIGAVIQGAVTAATGVNFGLIAIGIGFITALGVRFVGKGSTTAFGIIGGVCALFGALFGNVIAFAIMEAKIMDGTYADGFKSVFAHIVLVPLSMKFLSWLFIALAGYFGYKYSTAEDK